MTTYFVDFENVCDAGLLGIDNLAFGDEVYIFYSKNARKISIESYKKIVASSAFIHFVEVKVGSTNSLDVQLATFVGNKYKARANGNDVFCIVARDRIYEYVISFWQNKGIPIFQKKNML